MKIITIIKSGLKIISATILLIFIPSGLFYSCMSSYPSSRVNSQLFNSETKPCQTLEIKTAKKVTLQVTPNILYSDDIVAIYITGFQPFQIGSLKLSVTDSKDIRWESVACFQANEYGEINPENQAPIDGGSYKGKHTMGLFWSLKPEKLSSFHFDTDLNFTISFDTGDDDSLTRTILRKSYENIENHNITKKEIRNKIVANFYLHETDTQRPTIVLLPGSGGNFQHRKAGYIASKGYNVLDLKYFGEKNLPESLENVPLEYLAYCNQLVKK